MTMNVQFKKGVLEMVVLLTLLKKDMYGYELVNEVSKIIAINEGTVYPILKRLTNENYFESYLEESSEGPPRKYYKITMLGKERAAELKKEWETFTKAIRKFIKECEKND